MALLLKADLAAARDEFQLARKNPTYKAEKPWAKVADAGLEAIDDPLAPYRQPVVVPPVDLRAAARALDAGIAGYKAGRYDGAAAALTDATRNDPTDPVAWYYLGAVRWAQGNEDQARKDFAQGAGREKVTPVPSRTVSAALAPIQGAARDALDRARP
jgi:tetratricopeptide (TPR) repeat protein